ncbi:hypothetical protein D9M72_488970 [compost metagenome]
MESLVGDAAAVVRHLVPEERRVGQRADDLAQGVDGAVKRVHGQGRVALFDLDVLQGLGVASQGDQGSSLLVFELDLLVEKLHLLYMDGVLSAGGVAGHLISGGREVLESRACSAIGLVRGVRGLFQ